MIIASHEQTLMIDTDIIICDDVYKHCFDTINSFAYVQRCIIVSVQNLDYNEFNKISDPKCRFLLG